MMAQKTTTQAQQDGAEGAASAGAARAKDAHTDRLEAMFVELEKVQRKNLEQMESAIDEGAKLMKASLEYSGKMMDEWRRLTLLATQQAVSFSPPWMV